MLVGSFGKGEAFGYDVHSDIDLLLIDSWSGLKLVDSFHLELLEKWTDLEFDVGLYIRSRLQWEKTLFIYDLKHNGLVLAGQDARKLIPEIDVEDLFPFEGFRLLFNRAVGLLEAVSDAHQGKLIRARKRMKNAVRDAKLIFNKEFCSDPVERNALFNRSYGKQVSNYANLECCGRAFLEAVNYGIEKTGFKDLDELFIELDRKSYYPLIYRIHTFILTKNLISLWRNPIINIYTETYELFKKPVVEWTSESIKRIVRTFSKLHQPIIHSRRT